MWPMRPGARYLEQNSAAIREKGNRWRGLLRVSSRVEPVLYLLRQRQQR